MIQMRGTGGSSRLSLMASPNNMELLAITSMFTLSSALGIAAARLTLSALFYSMARVANRHRQK